MTQRQTLDTPQEMQNMGFDPIFQVSQIELLGHDSAGGVLRRIQTDSSGNLKIDPTNLDTRYLKKVDPPASANSLGSVGEYAEDDTYFYLCVDTNTWKRVEVSTWVTTTPITGNPIGLLLGLTYTI